MKRLLIISPYFPPNNAADMHRVRMSLPYFKEFGWEPTVVTVDPAYTDLSDDDLLTKTVPEDIPVYRVKAFDKKKTAKLGLGSIALRSLYFYHQTVSRLLKKEKFDLIYFSTTQFPVCILGALWKAKFKVPYVIDFQDPWFSDYYEDKPKDQRPPKYWFSYRLNKYLEPIALKKADGLISVSPKYIDDLKKRYPVIKDIPQAVIIFGASEVDRQAAFLHRHLFPSLLSAGSKNLVYIGRGGYDMHSAIKPLFEATRELLATNARCLDGLKFYFIGTSYAPENTGIPTIYPLAQAYGLQDLVIEVTNRIGYFHVLSTLDQADALFVPGSDDPAYIASKLLPFLMASKPLLTIFNSNSSATKILTEFKIATAYQYDRQTNIVADVKQFLIKLMTGELSAPEYDLKAVRKYDARTLTQQQCNLFDLVIDARTHKSI